MSNDRQSGGYGDSSSVGDGNNAFGSDFISFGSERAPEPSHNQWGRGRGRWRGQPQQQRISGTQRSHKSFMENDGPFQYQPQHNTSFRGSNHQDFRQPFQHRRGRPFRGDGLGFRGQRNQHGPRHQGPRFSNRSDDISCYYHPSMIEDPWQDLEKLLQIPESKALSSTSQLEPLDKETKGDIDSDNSADNNDSD